MQMMAGEYRKFQLTYNALEERESCIAGTVAVAAGFVTYLGPYHYAFRRMMMSYHWPKCLRERGIPLVVDSIDPSRGRVVEWSLFPYDLPGVMTRDESESEAMSQPTMGDEEEDVDIGPRPSAAAKGVTRAERSVRSGRRRTRESSRRSTPLSGRGVEEEGEEKKDAEKEVKEKEEELERLPTPPKGEEEEERGTDLVDGQSEEDVEGSDLSDTMSEFDIPLLDTEEYNRYIRALLTVITSEQNIQDWALRGEPFERFFNFYFENINYSSLNKSSYFEKSSHFFLYEDLNSTASF